MLQGQPMAEIRPAGPSSGFPHQFPQNWFSKQSVWQARIGVRSPLLPSEGLSWMEEGEIINSLPSVEVSPNGAFTPLLSPTPKLRGLSHSAGSLGGLWGR